MDSESSPQPGAMESAIVESRVEGGDARLLSGQGVQSERRGGGGGSSNGEGSPSMPDPLKDIPSSDRVPEAKSGGEPEHHHQHQHDPHHGSHHPQLHPEHANLPTFQPRNSPPGSTLLLPLDSQRVPIARPARNRITDLAFEDTKDAGMDSPVAQPPTPIQTNHRSGTIRYKANDSGTIPRINGTTATTPAAATATTTSATPANNSNSPLHGAVPVQITPAMRVRAHLITRIVRGLGSLGFYSRLSLLARTAIALAQIAGFIVALSISSHDTCDRPLRTYLSLYVVRTALNLPLMVYAALEPPRLRGPQADSEEGRASREARRVMGSPVWDSRVKLAGDLLYLFAFIWFIVGNIWLWGGDSSCINTSPALWYSTLASLIIWYLLLAEYVLLIVAVIFFLPFLIVVFRIFGVGVKKHEIGPLTKDEIEKIPEVLYIPDDKFEEPVGTSGASGAEGGVRDQVVGGSRKNSREGERLGHKRTGSKEGKYGIEMEDRVYFKESPDTHDAMAGVYGGKETEEDREDGYRGSVDHVDDETVVEIPTDLKSQTTLAATLSGSPSFVSSGISADEDAAQGGSSHKPRFQRLFFPSLRRDSYENQVAQGEGGIQGVGGSGGDSGGTSTSMWKGKGKMIWTNSFSQASGSNPPIVSVNEQAAQPSPSPIHAPSLDPSPTPTSGSGIFSSWKSRKSGKDESVSTASKGKGKSRGKGKGKGKHKDKDDLEYGQRGADGRIYIKTRLPLHPLSANLSTCPICLSDYEPPPLLTSPPAEILKYRPEPLRLLPCGHCIHSSCLEPWLLNQSGRCPVCQAGVKGETSGEGEGKKSGGGGGEGDETTRGADAIAAGNVGILSVKDVEMRPGNVASVPPNAGTSSTNRAGQGGHRA